MWLSLLIVQGKYENAQARHKMRRLIALEYVETEFIVAYVTEYCF
jgi:hypothetical protein